MVRILSDLKMLKRERIVGFLAMVFLLPSIAYAASSFAPDPCDPDYYESLEARAWLEAQREITQNQNLIFKPDSVLEYTCFDGFLSELADHAGNPANVNKMFTATNRWGTPPTNVPTNLGNVVGASINDYDTNNFNHNLLGGRITSGSPSAYTLPAAVSAGTYTCNVMDQVWRIAKCMDFIDNATNDGFFTFQEYNTDPDKRFLPTPCSKTANFKTNMDLATLDSKTPWQEDPVTTYYNLIYPSGGGCGGSGGLSTKIQTGLIVLRNSGGSCSKTKFDEYVCTVPGCHYDPCSGGSGKCVP